MKLLFVGFLHGYGGAEKQLIMLSNQMAERGHDVYLLSLSQNNPCYPINEQVHYFFQEDESNNKVINVVERYKYLKARIFDITPDVIVHFNVQPAFLCSLMGKKIASKTIYAERGDPYDKEYSGVNGLIRAFMMQKIGGFVFQTSGAQKCFCENIRNRSVVISNPIFINPHDYMRAEEPEKRIVTVGRLHEQKNQKLFIEAVSMLPIEYKDFTAEIYGEGELASELQQLIISKKSHVEIKLMGAHKDVLKKIEQAALFVLTSDYEGMPNALMEAMALGIPCISTDCRPGGARELIEDGKSGYIVPCGNIQVLSERIKTLLSDTNGAEKMATVGKQTIMNLLPEKIYEQWEQFLRSKCDEF